VEEGEFSVVGGLKGDLSGSCTSDLLLLLEFFTASFDGDCKTDLCLLLAKLLAQVTYSR
jgi:hypothetical protein